MAEFTVVYGTLADAVIRGSVGRRLGRPITIALDNPHWTSPSADALQLDEHAYVIWKESLIEIDTLNAWSDFQMHFEKVQKRDSRWSSYQLVAVSRDTHMKLFHRHPKMIRRVNISYWATPTHDMNPNDQLRYPSLRWSKWLLRRHKGVYHAGDPSRSTHQRLKNEHIYAVMQWSDNVFVACVDTEFKWSLFKRYRYHQTTVRPVRGLYTYDNIPTRFIIVSEKQWRKIEATTAPVEWKLNRRQ